MKWLLAEENRDDENRQERGVENRSRKSSDDQPAGMCKGSSTVGQERSELQYHEQHQRGRREKSSRNPAPSPSRLLSPECAPVTWAPLH